MFIPKMIAKDISIKENVMTDSVKEGTEGIVDISPTKLDATEETAASTYTQAVEKKKKKIWKREQMMVKIHRKNINAINVTLKLSRV